MKSPSSQPSPAFHGATNVLRVESIVAGGHGLARRPDGRVVFIARAAPGELVEVEYIEEHRQWLRGRLVRLLESSPARREPVCLHYERCGGCQLQHLRYEAQLTAKTAIIAESMRRLGGLEAPPPQAVPSVRQLGYRNRIALIMRREDDGFVAGYHAYDDPAVIVGIDSCPLAEPAINDAWYSLKSFWEREPDRLPSGDELRLTLRTGSYGDVGLVIETVRERSAYGISTARGRGDRNRRLGLLTAVPSLVAVWRLDARGKIRSHEGAESLRERSGPYDLLLAGTTFLQVNRETASSMDTYVREQCGPIRGKRVIDAYCGHGMRAIELALAGADVTGIDLDRLAIKAGRRLASEAGASVRLVAAAVEQSLRRRLPADIVVLNPPRRGLARPVAGALAENPPGRIVYVSCNPATLARDFMRLAGQYELTACLAFDLFPQTAHVETVATLARRGG